MSLPFKDLFKGPENINGQKIMSRVLITDAGSRNVIAAIRSLGRQGIDVIAAEESRIAMGFFSKFCCERLIYPSPKKEPEKWLDWLLKEISRRRYEMIMPIDDDTVSITAKNKAKIQEYTKVPLPDYDTLMKAKDKACTIRIATELGLSCPKTWFVEDTKQLPETAEKVDYPAVIKPKQSSGSRGICYVGNKQELVTNYCRIHSQYPFPMIQEFIPPGGQAKGIFLLFNKKNQVRAAFAHKRLREFPVKGGPSTLRESIHAPELLDQSVKILKAMKWYGIAMVEFKQDPRDDQFKIMEINPRFWGSLQLSILAGVDFPYLLYKMEMDGDIEPVTSYKEGIRCRWLLPGDILHFILNPNRFSLEPSFFNFSKNNRQDDFISLKDPGPTFGFFLAVIRNLFNLEKWRHVFKR
jgi:predicted ATP-grasp superfamily ATP-dependent carboligase